MKRILIVDDAIELGRLLQDAIKTVHPEVSTSLVPSAEEALLESARLAIDLLVTDLRLPGMTGTELIRKIRVRQPGVRVILMTGMVEDERLEKQKQEAQPDIYLHKPISVSSFLDAVERLLAPKEAPVKAAETEQEAVLREVSAMLPGELVPAKPKPASVKRGTGLLKLPVQQPEPAPEGLSGILSRLRGSLGAAAVLLLDERGHSVAQAGELPDPAMGEQLISPLMAALSAGSKISYLLGPGSEQSVHAYRGESLDILAAPAGPYALVVATRPGRSTTRMALAFEETLEAQAELKTALEAMGVRIVMAESAAPEAQVEQSAAQEDSVSVEILATPLGQDLGLEKFEELFAKKKTGVLHLQDPDEFWNQVSSGETAEVNQPGVLSFEQAQKLGLVPADPASKNGIKPSTSP